MPPRHGADRLAARHALGNDPRLVLRAPGPSPTRASEYLDPPDRLRDSTMLSVHSKPNGQNQTADSQNYDQSKRWGQNTAYAANRFPGAWEGEDGDKQDRCHGHDCDSGER